MNKKNTLHVFYKILHIGTLSSGIVFIILLLLSFTSAPFWIWYRHSVSESGIHRPPDFIVVLGGGGMPSETGLMRCWYASEAADQFPKSKIIISLPGDTTDTLSSVQLMKKELILRWIAHDRILFENKGTNTRAQAINIKELITNYELRSNREHQRNVYNGEQLRITNNSSIVNRQSSILIVTSPEHLTRAVLTFRKAGFLKTDGVPAFERAIESDITFNDRLLGGRKWIPDVGGNLSLRYRFWSQLRYEELIIREYFAIFYYKIKGWI